MRKQIILIATAWGPKYGGLNSFNYDLCISLAKIAPNYDIFCVVDEATEYDNEDTRKRNIKLINLNGKLSYENSHITIINQIKKSDRIASWFIGHDTKTGQIALNCKLHYQNNTKCAVIHHMDYQSYESIKPSYELAKLKERLNEQKRILKDSDIVFAIGPKLFSSATDKLRGSKIKVVELVPGLPSIDGIPIPKKFDAVIFGRFDDRIEQLKQYKLAIAACAKAIGSHSSLFGADPGITFIGMNELASGDKNEINLLLQKYAHQRIRINFLPYEEDRENLFDELKSHSVCLMLSLHEGFGLVGWESIAAEVPLIISQNTGLYQLVEERLGGIGVGNLIGINLKGNNIKEFEEKDVIEVSNALIKFKSKEKLYKENAVTLKGFLKNFFVWEFTASHFASNLELEEVTPIHPSIEIKNWIQQVLSFANSSDSSNFKGLYKRKDLFEILWDRIKSPSHYTERLIFFGGISTALCDDEALIKFFEWLKKNTKANLFFCYESGRSASERAKKLDEQNLLADNLSHKPEERMSQKQDMIHLLERKLKEIFVKDRRYYFQPLNEPLNSYIIIADNDVFVTPLFERRSSETITFSLERGNSFNVDILNYISYHLKSIERVENNHDSKELLSELVKLNIYFQNEKN